MLKSVQSKGKIIFSGLKELLGVGIQFQRMLFIALLVFYLTVRLVETTLLYLSR